MKSAGKILRGSPLEDVPTVSLSEYMLRSMRANRDRNLMVDAITGKSITNGEILEKSVQLASVLETYGVKMDDKISIVSENHPNWLIPACATLYLGAVLVPYNPAYTEWEFKNILEISKPRIVFVSRRTERLFVKIAPTLNWQIKIFELDDEALTGNIPTLEDLLQMNSKFVDPYKYEPAPIADNNKKLAVILCSSGTTGPPKGVMLSHRNLMFFVNAVKHPSCLDFRRDDKILVFLPFYHGYAFGLLVAAMSSGATVVAMSTFDIEVLLRSIGKYGITHLPVVPPVLVLIAKHPTLDDYDFSSVRELMCGAAPLPKGVADIVRRRLPRGAIRNCYGMTELSVIVCLSDRSHDNDENVGYLVPGILCKVIDQVTRETLGAGQNGEVCFKGGYVMLGYYGNPRITAETIDQEGWLHTGDLGYYDEKDRLYITGRLKELIKYKGFQVSPSEIETVLLSHPGVKDAAVVGKTDEVSGELPMAFVVRQPGNSVSEKEIVQLVSRKLSPQKWLRGGVKFIETIPKNPTGKILRRELPIMIAKL